MSSKRSSFNHLKLFFFCQRVSFFSLSLSSFPQFFPFFLIVFHYVIKKKNENWMGIKYCFTSRINSKGLEVYIRRKHLAISRYTKLFALKVSFKWKFIWYLLHKKKLFVIVFCSMSSNCVCVCLPTPPPRNKYCGGFYVRELVNPLE
mgnify:CR=1 FL=1